jgi:hypothetical protein
LAASADHMTNMFEDTNPRELKELLGQIHKGEVGLPDFQRDFVWDPHATQELVVSIASNYPAGSLLRIRNTQRLFACREFQGAAELSGHGPTFLVLDGQQRLTSLYQAFYGVGEHRYFLNLRRLLDGADFEEAIFHLRANHRRARQYESFDTQAQELILPLSVFKGGRGEFIMWTRHVARTLQGEERVRLENALDEHVDPWVQRIDDYRFPVVTLSDETPADAVCTIFETLNRTGVKLSAFELLTARFWPKNVNLRSLWASAKERFPIIDDFEIDPYYALQAVSLACRAAPSCKRGDVLDLEAPAVEEWWERAIEGLGRALEILRDDCGVMVPKWLPYYTILVPIAAILAKRPLPGGPDGGAVRNKLVRWYWCAVFGQAYENAPNSQSAKDVVEVIRWLDGGAPPATVADFRFDPRILRDTTSRQRALYRGIMGLVLRRGPRDFHTNRRITGELIVEKHIDDHHVFPDAHLKGRKPPVPERLINCVLNRTLIDRKTNIRISDNPPSKYLRAVRKALDREADFNGLLRSHLLPSGDVSPFWRDDFEEFLNWRQAALWKEIQEVTGVTEETDLIDEAEAA